MFKIFILLSLTAPLSLYGMQSNGVTLYPYDIEMVLDAGLKKGSPLTPQPRPKKTCHNFIAMRTAKMLQFVPRTFAAQSKKILAKL